VARDPHAASVVTKLHAGDNVPDLPLSELLLRINKGVRFEKELLVDPDFFLALAGRLPGLAAVEMDIKRGAFHSEFSMFRYDVTFTKEGGAAAVAAMSPVSYELQPYDAMLHSPQQLTAILEREQPDVLALCGLVDARLAELDCLVHKVKTGTVTSKTNGDLLIEIAAAATARVPVEPEVMYRLGEAAGYTTTLFWPPGTPAAFDCLFVRNTTFPTADARAAVEPLALAAARLQWGTRKGDAVMPLRLVRTDYELYTNRGQLARGSAGLDDGRRTLTSTQVAALKEAVRSTMPEYMVPAAFVGLTRMPATSNGKVDRKALPEPTSEDIAAAIGRSADFVKPVGETETAVAELWCELLGLDAVSTADDFFDIGGHSLLAMQMLGKLRKLFGVSLSLTQLLRVTALHHLAAYLDTERSHADLSSLAAAGTPAETVVTLSSAAPNIRLFTAADLPFTVHVTSHVTVPMADGTTLAGLAWMPQPRDGEESLRRPALLDVLPYRTEDGTVEVDSATYPYLAGHGFACVRLDTRGTGDSTGHLDDEYSSLGLADVNTAVAWAAAQPWCDGQVVLLGCSWGGITALQAAAVPAPALKGVIAVCATEDRFNDDMHYMGGALLSTNLSWGTWMLHTVAQPPSLPAHADGERRAAWEEAWLDRLEALQPPHTKWMRRPTEDQPYWSENSLKKVPGGAPRVPVLAVGGAAAGGYANSLARLSAAGAAVRVAPVKTILGPWAHQLPHLSPVGPQYGFLQVLPWPKPTRHVWEPWLTLQVVPLPHPKS
jgi:pimeloyl-ACP methyl ester carboxylesterase/acyl carrier protein